MVEVENGAELAQLDRKLKYLAQSFAVLYLDFVLLADQNQWFAQLRKAHLECGHRDVEFDRLQTDRLFVLYHVELRLLLDQV